MSGDDVYAAFPNLYAIRGTPARHPITWARTVRFMRSLGAEYLVPSHGPPVTGSQKIYDLLTVYSSAMQYVHDQSVRRMNELHHPDDIGRMVKLPPALASHPYLGEFYGMVEWSAKSVYHRYVGWFSGDPAELLPLTPSERAHALVDLIGLDRYETIHLQGDLLAITGRI
jgi:alkyl sulfatase BDS1-like metallo-beta-lactamase superfamily hydrolase